MEKLIITFIIAYILGLVVAAVFAIHRILDAYEDGYKEGWLDAKERYIKKLRQISNQELVDDFVNSLREP